MTPKVAGSGENRSASPVASARSNPRRESVAQLIDAEAMRLFSERGFAGTRLQDIAEATGLTRPAIYHYVRSKDDLLARLVADVAEGPARRLREINSDKERPAPARLREMAYELALRQASQPERFKVLFRSENELPPELSAHLQSDRRTILKELVAAIEEGMHAGQIRPVDARVAAFAVIGMCNWVAWWHHPSSAEENQATASQVADIAVAALIHPDTDAAEPGLPEERALRRIKDEVALLEKLVAHTRPGRPASAAE